MPTKLQHYVPRFYLEGFADPENPTNIWVYDKKTLEVRSQGIKGTGAETYYYSIEAPKSKMDDFFEREILNRNEGTAVSVIRRWREEQRPAIISEDVRAVAPFLALAYIRSPRMRSDTAEMAGVWARNQLQDILEDDQELDDFLKTHPQFHDTKNQLREALEAAQDPKRISIEPNKNFLISLPFSMADKIIPYIISRRWALLENTNKLDLITSDSPLSVFELKPDGRARLGVGIGRSRAELTLPISPRRALRLSLWEKRPFRRIGVSEVREINRRIAYQANRYIYASRKSKKILRVVEEFQFTVETPRIEREAARRAFVALRDEYLQREPSENE